MRPFGPLAERLNVSFATDNRWEIGIAKPLHTALQKIQNLEDEARFKKPNDRIPPAGQARQSINAVEGKTLHLLQKKVETMIETLIWDSQEG
jgi:hypothetical protein